MNYNRITIDNILYTNMNTVNIKISYSCKKMITMMLQYFQSKHV